MGRPGVLFMFTLMVVGSLARPQTEVSNDQQGRMELLDIEDVSLGSWLSCGIVYRLPKSCFDLGIFRKDMIDSLSCMTEFEYYKIDNRFQFKI